MLRDIDAPPPATPRMQPCTSVTPETAVQVRDSTAGRDSRVACECTDGEWGRACPDCGQLLPARKPWSGWRSERIDPVTSANARLSSTGNYFSRLKAAQMSARQLDPVAALIAERVA